MRGEGQSNPQRSAAGEGLAFLPALNMANVCMLAQCEPGTDPEVPQYRTLSPASVPGWIWESQKSSGLVLLFTYKTDI